MSKEPFSVFHRELLNYLKQETIVRGEEEGFFAKEDPEYQALSEDLEKALSFEGTQDRHVSLEEILKSYQYLFETRGPIQIEQKLFEMFSKQEFVRLSLLKEFPKIYRGLPRLYRKGRPSESHIKKNFTHLPSLIGQVAENAILTQYQDKEPQEGSLVLFTYVMADGLGDFYLGLKTLKVLRAHFSNLQLEWVILLPKHLKRSILRKELQGIKGVSFFSYEKEGKEALDDKALEILSQADVILQIPTYFPQTEEIKQKCPNALFFSVGEYGFLESSWFHPKSKNRSMGFHFLEKGVFVEEPKKKLSLLSLKQPALLKLLLGKENPTAQDEKNYYKKRHLYFAYISTFSGGFVYLHALFQFLENDVKPLDICMPDFWFFVKILEEREGKPLFEKDFGIEQIEFYFGEEKRVLKIGAKGKKVRIFSTGALSSKDFEILMSVSGPFVAVRGNQSFSEALGYEKVFFYDGREHSRFFFKDLLALVTNRLTHYPSVIKSFQAMAKAFLHTLPEQTEDWVDETYFQEKEPLLDIAIELGKALQEKELDEGFRKLSKIVREEYSFADFLLPFVKRAFYHLKHPEVAAREKELLQAFIEKKSSFTSVILNLREILHDRDS